MLQLSVKPKELFDEEESRFIYLPAAELTFEHSLVSLSKWESKYKKPFFADKNQNENFEKTVNEVLDYFLMMCLETVDPNIIFWMDNEEIKTIGDYLQEEQTATWFSDQNSTPSRPSRKVITSELIYYWLIALSIPFDVETWNLNRLLTLIQVVNQENDPKKNKKPTASLMAQRRQLNAQRRAKFGHGG